MVIKNYRRTKGAGMEASSGDREGRREEGEKGRNVGETTEIKGHLRTMES